MTDRGAAIGGKDSLAERPFRHGHVHFGMAFHDSFDAFLSLPSGGFDQTRRQENFKKHCHDHDHQVPADEFCRRELPAHQNDHDDAEFDYQVRRSELESHRCRKVRALAKD